MSHKERLTVTVDPELLKAANQAIAEGRAATLSGWVNLALTERAAKEQRLRMLAEAAAAYEDEFGEITGAEILAQDRIDRQRALISRPRKRARNK